MKKHTEITYLAINNHKAYSTIIDKVLTECFKKEGLENTELYVNVILTDPENIKAMNAQYRHINKETDVLSFPMFDKNEIASLKQLAHEEVLGDIIISIERVKQQAEEYGHSFERELAYMVVHGFYHLMGEDHINEKDQESMRQKEEHILEILHFTRGEAKKE